MRLPRDWLGPREELVPVGGGRTGPEEIPPASDPGHEQIFAPSADDFWGEHSASVQDAVQPPPRPRAVAGPARDQPVAPAEPAPGASTGRRRAGALRPSRLPALTAAALVLVALGGVLLSRGTAPPSSLNRDRPLTTSPTVGTLTGALTRAERQLERAGAAMSPRPPTARARVAVIHAKRVAPARAASQAPAASAGAAISSSPSGTAYTSPPTSGSGSTSGSTTGSGGGATPPPSPAPSRSGPTGNAPFGPGTPG